MTGLTLLPIAIMAVLVSAIIGAGISRKLAVSKRDPADKNVDDTAVQAEFGGLHTRTESNG